MLQTLLLVAALVPPKLAQGGSNFEPSLEPSVLAGAKDSANQLQLYLC